MMLHRWTVRLILMMAFLYLLSGCAYNTVHERAALRMSTALMQLINTSDLAEIETISVLLPTPTPLSPLEPSDGSLEQDGSTPAPVPTPPSQLQTDAETISQIPDLDLYVCLREELDGLLDYASLLITVYGDPDNRSDSGSTWFRELPEIGVSLSELHLHYYAVLLWFDGLQLPADEQPLYQIYLNHHPRMYEQLERAHDLALAEQLSGEELLSIIDEFIVVGREFQAEYEQFVIDYQSSDFQLHPLNDTACAKFFSAFEIQSMTDLLDEATSSPTPAPTPVHYDPIEITEAKLRVVSTEGLRWTISWMVEVTNNTVSPVTIVVTAKFNDADGFTLAKAHKLDLTVPAYGTISYSDLTSVEPAVGQAIETMSVEFFEQ